MANVNVQDQLNDNKDFLEKKSGSLSETEKWKLESIRSSNDVVENAKKTILDIKAKDWTTIKINAETLMKEIANWVALAEGTNYKIKLNNANIVINGKQIDNSQFWRGSELMAFLQVAAWSNLVPDGKFWRETAAAFSSQLSKVETKQNQPKMNFETVGVNEINTHNFYSEFVWLFGAANAKLYKDTYKAFNATKGTLNCTNYNGQDVNMSYTSIYKSKPEAISFKLADIQKADLNIDNEKLMNKVKSMIENNENKLKLESWKESVIDWIEDVQVSSFSPFIQEYIKWKWWTAGWEIDFNPWKLWSGMVVSNGLLTINLPWKINVSLKLSDVQTNNKFDQNKFVSELTKTITPLAKEWKKEQYANQYNGLKSSVSALTSNLSTDYIASTKARIVSLENLSNQIKVDKNVSWTDLIKEIDARKSLLKTRLSYLEMKERDEAKVRWFEQFLNVKAPKTAWDKMKFDNEVNAKKGEYKIFRDNFNDRVKTYVHVSSTDRSNFDKRLKTIDKLYGYNS